MIADGIFQIVDVRARPPQVLPRHESAHEVRIGTADAFLGLVGVEERVIGRVDELRG